MTLGWPAFPGEGAWADSSMWWLHMGAGLLLGIELVGRQEWRQPRRFLGVAPSSAVAFLSTRRLRLCRPNTCCCSCLFTSPFPCPHLHRFIYLVGCVGAYAFATALCGLAGVKRDRRLQLGAYILLLALLVSRRTLSF